MPIQTRLEMLTTGIRSQLGIKVFGNDLSKLEEASVAIEQALADLRGTRSVFAERATGGFFLDVKVNRQEASRFGLSVQDVNEVVMTAIGGMNVSETVEGRERYPIQVRYAREFREPSRSPQTSPRSDSHRRTSALASGRQRGVRDRSANDPKRGRTTRELGREACCTGSKQVGKSIGPMRTRNVLLDHTKLFHE